MKKFLKAITSIVSLAALGFGAYCVYKKVMENRDLSEDEDFDDLFEDEEYDSDEEKNSREYVSINIYDEDAKTVNED